VETRRADVDFFGLDAFFRDHFLKRLEHDGFALVFLRRLKAERLDDELLEPQPASFVHFELGQLETTRPKIDR
jgi:hypothetical protein